MGWWTCARRVRQLAQLHPHAEITDASLCACALSPLTRTSRRLLKKKADALAMKIRQILKLVSAISPSYSPRAFY